MKANLNGRWAYRSFRHGPISVKDGKVEGAPQLALPWTPVGDFDAATNDAGEVTATLTFGPGVVLQVAGKITSAGTTPAGEERPAAMEVTGEGRGSHYAIKGFFVTDDCVVGTVLCTANDLAKQPVGTAGPFVLLRARR